MVLLIDDQVIEEYTSAEDLLTGGLKTASQAFADRKPEIVYKRQKCLYVGQREMAVFKVDNKHFDFFGSEDATTCHVALLRERNTGTCGVIHIDSDENKQLHDLVCSISLHDMAIPPGAPPIAAEDYSMADDYNVDFDLYLVGGFSDDRNISKSISDALFDYVIKTKSVRFHLKLFCAGSVNTEEREGVSWPKHYGAAIRITSGEVFPAQFLDHGPDTDIRSTRMHSQADGVLKLVDGESGRIVIPPFDYQPLRNCKYWLELDDSSLLDRMSTSPKVEPARFCEDMRALFRRMLSDPEPMKTIFKDGQKREYVRDQETGDWELLDSEKFLCAPPRAIRPAFSVKDFIRDAKTDQM